MREIDLNGPAPACADTAHVRQQSVKDGGLVDSLRRTSIDEPVANIVVRRWNNAPLTEIGGPGGPSVIRPGRGEREYLLNSVNVANVDDGLPMSTKHRCIENEKHTVILNIF